MTLAHHPQATSKGKSTVTAEPLCPIMSGGRPPATGGKLPLERVLVTDDSALIT